MSGYLAPNDDDDANPQLLSGPSATSWPAWAPDVSTWNLYQEAGGLHGCWVSCNLQAPVSAVSGNTPIEDYYTGNDQRLLQAFDEPGLPNSGALENPEEYPVIQASHGKVEFFLPFTCFGCLRVFRNNSKLLDHGKAADHHPYACFCGKTFSRLFSVTRHLSSREVASVAGSAGPRHPCPLCTKYDGEYGFNRRDHLRQHLRVFHKLDNKGMESIMGPTGRRAVAPAEAVSNAAGAVAHNIPHVG
ncbi:hypothetical protein FHL15_010887 [Xylaria flabelliformis]|uniref:C2H2-type domain-containing protein n=1 Tax=Xylaria flabelliformis TaxID=2512241 RepID=A0A553HJS2_9PEZI|nr:hypothetical protein FHL15_010887 [Xylaria flabelliformis]